MRFLVSALLVFILSILSPGCGDGQMETVPITGIVTMNGKPLTGYPGTVSVEPKEGRPATGNIDPETGKFTLTSYKKGDGVIAGTHPVSVIIIGQSGEESVSLIPEKYGNSSTSGLTVTIDDSGEELTIPLEGELKPLPTEAPVE